MPSCYTTDILQECERNDLGLDEICVSADVNNREPVPSNTLRKKMLLLLFSIVLFSTPRKCPSLLQGSNLDREWLSNNKKRQRIIKTELIDHYMPFSEHWGFYFSSGLSFRPLSLGLWRDSVKSGRKVEQLVSWGLRLRGEDVWRTLPGFR